MASLADQMKSKISNDAGGRTAIPALYHGTSVGWLKYTGLSVQPRPFGEASRPRSFIHLTDSFEVARKSARNSCDEAQRRLTKNVSTPADFIYRGEPFEVARYVYTIQFPALPFVDLNGSPLTSGQLVKALKVLWKGQIGPRGLSQLLFGFCKSNLDRHHFRDWLADVAKSRRQGDEVAEELLAKVLFEMGVPLIRGLERDPPVAGSETWSLANGCPPSWITRVEKLPACSHQGFSVTP